MKLVPLTHGLFAKVDDEDFERVSPFSWYAHFSHRGNVYARGRVKGPRVMMHRLLSEAPAGFVVDHINGDTLDNRRSNLRVVSQAENMRYAGLI